MLVICLTGDQRRSLDQELSSLRLACHNRVCLLETHKLQTVTPCEDFRLPVSHPLPHLIFASWDFMMIYLDYRPI